MCKFQIIIALLILSVVPSWATTLSFSPTPMNVNLGQTFNVDILITSGLDLYAWQFDVGFDPSILQANSISEGGYLATSSGPTFFLPGTIDNSGGTVTFNADSIIGPFSGANGDGILATINFTTLDQGASPLNLFNVILINSFGEGETFSLNAGSVDVSPTPIPEPSTGILMVGGLAAIGVIRRILRRKLGLRESAQG